MDFVGHEKNLGHIGRAVPEIWPKEWSNWATQSVFFEYFEN